MTMAWSWLVVAGQRMLTLWKVVMVLVIIFLMVVLLVLPWSSRCFILVLIAGMIAVVMRIGYCRFLPEPEEPEESVGPVGLRARPALRCVRPHDGRPPPSQPRPFSQTTSGGRPREHTNTTPEQSSLPNYIYGFSDPLASSAPSAGGSFKPPGGAMLAISRPEDGLPSYEEAIRTAAQPSKL
nr:uncharacterized protein LOC123748246 [Procambarus clarkii]